MVPEYEEREGARFGLYSWERWIQLPWIEKAKTVGHYRIHGLIELHQNDAIAKEMERRSKKAQRH